MYCCRRSSEEKTVNERALEIAGRYVSRIARWCRALLRAIREWHETWVRLRTARYEHLAAILDTTPETGDESPTVVPCRASRRRR